MNAVEARRIVVEVLARLAPEANPADLPGKADLRSELDLDSMDFLNLIAALHARIGIDIPEMDYPKLATLDGAVAYLTDRQADRNGRLTTGSSPTAAGAPGGT